MNLLTIFLTGALGASSSSFNGVEQTVDYSTYNCTITAEDHINIGAINPASLSIVDGNGLSCTIDISSLISQIADGIYYAQVSIGSQNNAPQVWSYIDQHESPQFVRVSQIPLVPESPLNLRIRWQPKVEKCQSHLRS